MYHDSHAHLQLGNNSDEKLKNYENMYRKNLIGQMICNSTSENDFKEIEILSNQFKNRIIPCYGVHPWYIDHCTDGWLGRLKTRLINHPQSLVGEIGLDKKRNYGVKQKEIFESQLKLAIELKRPASIHCVRCHGTMFEILKKHLRVNYDNNEIMKKRNSMLKDDLPPMLLHGWSGSYDMSKMFALTFPNIYYSFSVPLRLKSLKGIPINRVLAETDDTDPINIQNAYKELAKYYKKSESEIIHIVNKNFIDCFGTKNIENERSDHDDDGTTITNSNRQLRRKIYYYASLVILLSINSLF